MKKNKHIISFWLFVAVLIILFVKPCLAGDNKPEYNIKNVSPLLMTDVEAIVRNYSLTFTVDDINTARLTGHYAVTILNADGKRYGEFSLTYDQFRKIDDFKATLYDSKGNEIRELDNAEIKDHAMVSWATLYSDNRIKTAELYYNAYPYTVEFDYKINYDGYINWPRWIPEERDASVEYSNYNVIIPAASKLRYRCFNFEQEPKVTKLDNGDELSYLWEVKNLPAVEGEQYGPPWVHQLKSVVVAPAKFKIAGYDGNLTSWKDFGDWIKKLWQNRQTLSPEAIKKVNFLTEGITDKKEKIKKLYEFLQSRTRYVDISFGVGDWQPIDAEKVYECGYGDCKALSNFMVSLLRCTGIKAYPVLIYSHDIPEKLDKQFPYNQFNHVIICVPMDQDTVWLECTSQSFPFGHIGSENENRFALLISDTGGKLVHTPIIHSQANEQIREASVTLYPNGKGKAEISTEFTGDKQDVISTIFSNYTSDVFDRWLKENLRISSYNIDKKSFQRSGNDNLSKLTVGLSLPNYAAVMGNRLFFSPVLIKNIFNLPEKNKERKFPIFFSYPFCDIDTVLYNIPDGYSIEAKPEDININNDYMNFKSSVSFEDSTQIIYTRYFEIKSSEMPASAYDNFRTFLQAVTQSDNKKVVLVKK